MNRNCRRKFNTKEDKMKIQIIRPITIGLLTALVAIASPSLGAADKGPLPDAVEKGKRNDRIPFRGKINSVDKTAMILVLEGKEKKRTIKVTSQTRMTKAGKPATLNDAIAGEEVAGQSIKTTDGKEEAISVRFGEKPESAAKEKKVKNETSKEK